MTSTGENSSSPIDGGNVYGSSTLDHHNDPFTSEGNGTTKFIGGGGGGGGVGCGSMNKFDFHTIKAANVANSKRSNRYELSKNELLHMLCYLEGELQARDVVIAALRNERVKQYIHALRAKRVNLDDPQAALFRDKAAITGNHVSRQSSAAAIQADLEVRNVIEQQIESLNQVITRQRQTQARMIAFLSDSLENNQRMRQELEEEKRKHEHDTAQGDDITYGLEMERTKLKQELDTERTQRKKLEKDVKKSQEMLEFERGRQKQIVLLLLAERKKIIMKYIEERKRSEDLAQILSEEKQRSDSIADGLEEESKKSLRMEAEMEKQAVAIEMERKTWKLNFAKEEKRIKDMEMELQQLRLENETFRKQIALRMATGTAGGGGTLSNKVRTGVVDEVTAATVASSSIMNVAKIIQPTATVSSVPVSGPTTGIARSISPGQCLRQPATVIGTGGVACDLILGAAGVPSFAATLGKPSTGTLTSENVTAKISGSIVTPNLMGGAVSLTANQQPPPLSPAPSQQCATIHRASIGGGIATTGGIGAGGGLLLNASGTTPAGMGRGVPPPIPPNKPTVPPKREPSISRISTSGVVGGGVVSGAIATSTVAPNAAVGPAMVAGVLQPPVAVAASQATAAAAATTGGINNSSSNSISPPTSSSVSNTTP